MVLSFPGEHGAAVRPARKAEGRAEWAKDPSAPGAEDGTRIDATFINDLVGMVRHLLAAYSVVAVEGDDTALAQAVAAALANHSHSMEQITDTGEYVRMTTAERLKLAAIITNYKGAFADLAAVAAAYPEAEAGEWAALMKPGADATIAIWDADAEPPVWVEIEQSPPQTAATVPFTPAGDLVATDVQAAVEELQSDILAHLAAVALNLAGKAPLEHDHDDRYYTQAQLDSALASYFSGVNIQVFTSSGTYTPTAGMKLCRIRVQAPGGGSGGADGTGSANSSVSSGGGGGGEYAEGIFTAAEIGASQSVTIGSPGAAGSNSGGNGGTGGTTSVGSLISAVGGGGGEGTGSNSTNSDPRNGGVGGTGGTGGYLRIPGQPGRDSEVITDWSTFGGTIPGAGGDSHMGFGGVPETYGDGDASAVAGSAYGGGAAGARRNSTTGDNGAQGAPGIVIIEEFF